MYDKLALRNSETMKYQLQFPYSIVLIRHGFWDVLFFYYSLLVEIDFSFLRPPSFLFFFSKKYEIKIVTIYVHMFHTYEANANSHWLKTLLKPIILNGNVLFSNGSHTGQSAGVPKIGVDEFSRNVWLLVPD